MSGRFGGYPFLRLVQRKAKTHCFGGPPLVTHTYPSHGLDPVGSPTFLTLTHGVS